MTAARGQNRAGRLRRMLARRRVENRQRRHHRPFRIAEPGWDATTRAHLRQLVEQLDAARHRSDESAPALVARKAVAEAATNLWRARKRIKKSTMDSKDGRQVGRYLSAAEKSLEQAGVAIQDHDGDPYHPGQSLEVLAFQEEPELHAEVVLETVRPTVYLGEECIQMAQVVVGVPADPTHQHRQRRNDE